MNRRSFLIAGVAIGATRIRKLQETQIIPVASNSSLFMGRRSAATPGVFPQSVGSGDPGTNGIVLWTRVSPDSALRSVGTPIVSWQISHTTETLPPAGLNLPLLRLGYISCQDFSNGYFTALNAMPTNR
jgi:phosphodiesterase/alkaline phosphatase D-like protein